MHKVLWRSFRLPVVGATLLLLTASEAVGPVVYAGPPDTNPNKPLTRGDVAFGGKMLEEPLALVNDGQFVDVLTIEGVQFKKGAAARALALGALSLSGKVDTGDAVVRLRLVIDGVPEGGVHAATLPDGFFATVPILVGCNSFPADDQPHTVALQAAVLGTGEVTVEAGDFHFTALRSIQVPPLVTEW